ncbi:uncharacterized protein CTHT_0053670 [Thermochaetoides thermophila DSM 1495]|uniref:Uncharacterized protein n=1 Tax=Chaetomium thermophilum (strain DSM 1495 / CBS 144.50 / IMI 039719) TaxID=759272 RepID=G0SBI2_CHATD|nr:hypothetical protein CTHT_0053670 [Thermochaetoides thermophila DSM 1495]EGS18758.1 hypothetical protein CTHT_0053670 [Thermochaetoides thermophila DSM 1495]
MSHMQSSGRGGAGNIVDSSKAPQIQPKDLETPTLKSEMVTTGRGGTGNMAANLDAEEKRRLQDVEPVVRRETQTAHIGRGGTGNVVKAGADASDEITSAAPGSPNLLTKIKSNVLGGGDAKEEKKERSSGEGDAPETGAAHSRRKSESTGQGLVEKGINRLFGKK